MTATMNGSSQSTTFYGKWVSEDIFVSYWIGSLVGIFKFNGANTGTAYFITDFDLFNATMDDITNAMNNSIETHNFTFTGTK